MCGNLISVKIRLLFKEKMNKEQIELYTRRLNRQEPDQIINFIEYSILLYISLSENISYISSIENHELQLHFSKYCVKALKKCIKKKAEIPSELINNLAYLCSISKNEKLIDIVTKLDDGNPLLYLCNTSKVMKHDNETKRFAEFFYGLRGKLESFDHQRITNEDYELAALLELNLLSVYSSSAKIRNNFKSPCSYNYPKEHERDIRYLNLGKGRSKDTRKDIFFILKENNLYLDLQVNIDHNYLYFYSPSLSSVIFTTGMNHERYFNIMKKESANCIVLANIECIADKMIDSEYIINLTTINYKKEWQEFRNAEISQNFNDQIGRFKNLLNYTKTSD